MGHHANVSITSKGGVHKSAAQECRIMNLTIGKWPCRNDAYDKTLAQLY